MNTVNINGQIWADQDLNVLNFKNGEAIPIIESNDEWVKLGKEKRPACCYFKNDRDFRFNELNKDIVIQNRKIEFFHSKLEIVKDELGKEMIKALISKANNEIDYLQIELNALKNQNYGVLYNWYAITDKGIDPEGFQLPNSNNWQLLIDFCDGEGNPKDTIWMGFQFSNSNEGGFNAVNHGSRSDDSGRFIKNGSWYGQKLSIRMN